MVFLSICNALYDYAPQAENELELQEGELVYIIEKSDEDDWWKAKKRAPDEGEEEPEGLIPNNYVEEAQPTHHAKALYDYNRQTDEELSFTENAALLVYDNTTDPEWTLVGLDGEFGFVPANYIEITNAAEQKSPESALSPQLPQRRVEPEPELEPEPEPEPEIESEPDVEPQRERASAARSGPAAAIAGIMHRDDSAAKALPPSINLPKRSTAPQYTPEESDEESPAPSLPQRPPDQMSPPPTQYASPRSPNSPGVAESPPYNRVVSQQHNGERLQNSAGGFHMYNINEVVSVMGKSKKMPTTLGLNMATGQIMIAPEKSRDGPQLEWTAEKLTHYSIEGKHVFMELVRPSKSFDFNAGAKDTAKEIVAGLGEIAGAARAEGLREVLEAAGGGSGQKKAQILYDFVAQGDDEVTVAVGDDVIVIDDSQSAEWWMVRRIKNGKEGVVPSSYVEVTGTIPSAPSSAGLNPGKSAVEQNRLEEERLTREAINRSKADAKATEVGPGVKLPPRGSSLTIGNDNNQASQRSKKESKHGRTSSSSKAKPDTRAVRTWTDRSGSFKVEAQFIGLKDGKIHLHKLNGVKIAVPVVKMAIEDLEYVEGVTGVSLDDDKPLSDIRRKNTQSKKEQDRKNVSKAGAVVEKPKNPKHDGPEYDWFDFFLKAGVSPYQCERYASNFTKDSMDESVLADITASVLRTLGLKEGDILRVMKYLDVKYGRTGDRGVSPDGSAGGLFSGPGGALRNNTSKGRPAPAVQSNDVVDASTFRQKDASEETSNKKADAVSTPLSTAPPPPKKDNLLGFDDDAWDVKPSKQQASAPQPEGSTGPQRNISAPPEQPPLKGNLLDLSSLQPALQPTAVQSPAPKTFDLPPIQQPQQSAQPPPLQQQPTGANPAFFSQLGQTGGSIQQQNLSNPPQAFSLQQNQQQPQQTGPPRQRPQAPQTMQQGSMIPPPPARPMSAPLAPQNSNFTPMPLQPQLTGYQTQNQIAPPGQSLNDLNQQRMQQQQQQQFNQQYNQQQLQPQQTGFIGQGQNFNSMNNGIMPQQTGFGQQQFQNINQQLQNPYVNGQQQGSPFADPRGQQQPGGFLSLQPQNTGYQPQFQPLQPQQTGVNSMLAPALQPQNTGVNGYSRPGFGQPIPPMPPMPPMPQQPTAAPLQPQKTGPAPPVRFGTPAANKLTPQPTGRKANLSAATPSNPFGF